MKMKTILAFIGHIQTHFPAMEIMNLMGFLIMMKVFFQYSPMAKMYSPNIIFLLEFIRETAFKIN